MDTAQLQKAFDEGFDAVKSYVDKTFDDFHAEIKALKASLPNLVAAEVAKIPVPKDGERGEKGDPGEKGADGKDGIDGKDGAPGLNGKDGAPGEPGKDGAPGANGLDGKDGAPGIGVTGALQNKAGELIITLADGTMVNVGLVQGKDGSNGIDGKDGAPGERGQPGIDGKDGANGIDGKDGAPGERGEKGEQGIPGLSGKDGNDGNNGKDGADGLPGKDGANGLDGKDGKDGLNGKDGAPGLNGKDGASNILVKIGKDGYAVAVDEKGNEAPLRGLQYHGVFRPEQKYVSGDSVTLGGNVYICVAEGVKGIRPDDATGEDRPWALAVKKGRDGKDGKVPVPTGPVKISERMKDVDLKHN